MDAKQISNAVALISDVGQQINALHLQLDSLFQNETINHTNISIGKFVLGEDVRELSNWLITKYFGSYGLTKKGNRNPSNWLWLQIDLDGSFADAGEPLIHISLAKEWPDEGIYLPSKDDNGSPVKLNSNGVLLEWNWEGKTESLSDQCWLFTVRLATLNSVDDLRNFLLKPAFKLIAGQRENIFSDNRYLQYEETENGDFRLKKKIESAQDQVEQIHRCSLI